MLESLNFTGIGTVLLFEAQALLEHLAALIYPSRLLQSHAQHEIRLGLFRLGLDITAKTFNSIRKMALTNGEQTFGA